MYIKKEYDFNDLYNNSWSGAVSTLDNIREAEKEEELMQLLEDVFVDIPTETDVNDYLWFNEDEIFNMLGIEEEE